MVATISWKARMCVLERVDDVFLLPHYRCPEFRGVTKGVSL